MPGAGLEGRRGAGGYVRGLYGVHACRACRAWRAYTRGYARVHAWGERGDDVHEWRSARWVYGALMPLRRHAPRLVRVRVHRVASHIARGSRVACPRSRPRLVCACACESVRAVALRCRWVRRHHGAVRSCRGVLERHSCRAMPCRAVPRRAAPRRAAVMPLVAELASCSYQFLRPSANVDLRRQHLATLREAPKTERRIKQNFITEAMKVFSLIHSVVVDNLECCDGAGTAGCTSSRLRSQR